MLKVGDRVKLKSNHSSLYIPKGSTGILERISNDRYYVNFDKYQPTYCYKWRVESVLSYGHQLLLFEVD